MKKQNRLEDRVRFAVQTSRKAIRKEGTGRSWFQILAVVAAALTGGTGPGTDKSRFWDAE